MRALITGDREWIDKELIKKALDELKPTEICHGAARGADTIAGNVAFNLGILVSSYPAQWKKYGRAAGPIRNRDMLSDFNPDCVIAFHDNLELSKGTKDMIAIAKQRGLVVYHYHH